MSVHDAKAAFIAGWKAAELYPKLGPAMTKRILEDFYEWRKQNDGWPESAVGCVRCDARAAVRLDGMLTCLQCGHNSEVHGS